MKLVIFDSGPIISLALNNLLYILEKLKIKSKVQLAIPKGVKYEIVDKPIKSKRFKFEALLIKRLIENGTLQVLDDPAITRKCKELDKLANNIIKRKKHAVKILQLGELEVLAAALLTKAEAIVVDERITRTLIEKPRNLERLMEKRLHTNLDLDKTMLQRFQNYCKNLKIIRSIELAAIAYEKGILDNLIVKIPHARKELLDGILWALKLSGASITEQEIRRIVQVYVRT